MMGWTSLRVHSFIMVVTLRALLFTLVAAFTAPFCAANWPCPPPNDIKPCTCTTDAEQKLYMDCSAVKSTAALVNIFQTHFSFNEFQSLTIKPVNASDSLQELPAGVFGKVSFEEIHISGTIIHTVEEQALVNSHNRLAWLDLTNNKIANFPFETLKLFTVLVELDISSNKLSGNLPDIVSSTLITLKLSGNGGLMLTDTAFLQATYVSKLYLNGLQLGTSMPPNVFKELRFLTVLSLENSGITAEIIENLVNPQPNTLTALSFKGNKIAQIHRLAVTGMKDSGIVSFNNNNIEYLYQGNWEGLISQLSLANAIDIRNNPLVCGCDVKWLVFDRDLIRIFHENTTCAAGIKLVDLTQDWFNAQCP